MRFDQVDHFITNQGVELWTLGGDYHRVDGPACEWADGSKSWWVNGKRHRTDGPAIEHSNGQKFWYLFGKEYDPLEWLLKVHELTR